MRLMHGTKHGVEEYRYKACDRCGKVFEKPQEVVK